MAMSAEDISAGLDGRPSLGSYGPLYEAAGGKYGFPPLLLRAIAQVESSENPKIAPSNGGAAGTPAYGMMQITQGTAQHLGVDPLVVEQAVPGSAKYLREGADASLATTGGKSQDLAYALKYYHGGPNTKGWGPMTASYPGKVMAAYAELGGDPTKDFGIPKEVLAAYKAQASATPANNPQVVSADKIASDLDGSNTPTITPMGAISKEDALAALERAANISAQQTRTLTQPGAAALAAVGVKPQVGQAGPGVISTPAQNPNLPQWGPFQNAASGALLGYGPEAEAGVAAIGRAGQNMLTGQGIGKSLAGIPQSFSQVLPQIQGQQQGWQAANPTANLATGGIGSLLPLLAGAGLVRSGAETAAPVVSRVAGPIVGEAVNAAGRFLGGTAGAGGAGAGNMLLRTASRAAGGAAEGAGQGAASTHMTDQGAEENAATGAKIGAVVGPLGGLVQNLAGRVMNAPMTKTMAELALSPIAKRIGVPGLRMAQGGTAKTAQKVLGPGDEQGLVDRWNQEVNDLLRGPKGNSEITPELVADSYRKAGQAMDQTARQLAVVPDRTLVTDLTQIARDLRAAQLTDVDPLSKVKKYLDKTLLQMQTFGQLDGEEFAKAVRFDGPLGRLQRDADSSVRYTANQVFDALDAAAKRSAQTSGNAAAYAAWKEAKTWYKDTLVAEQAVKKPSAVGGRLDPTTFKNIVNSIYTRSGKYGAGEIGDLADLGTVMPKVTVQGDIAKGHTSYELGRKAGELLFAGGAGLMGAEHFGLMEPYAIPAIGMGLMGYGGLQAGKSALAGNAFREHLANVALGNKLPLRLPNITTPTLLAGALPHPDRRLVQ